ncbi:hypothetical protein [Novosphingobium sp.]|uniref:hypothetical protein n=1 Tax=Novosphingobium sp. TaxID=1874826 RepID=UPI00286E1E43|nr:hypothetical protein [Novosphingobium sp.]
MMEPASAGFDAPRAYLRLGGATLAHHQLALALAAGCERIACLAKAFDPELAALQREAERAGARFHMISGGRALSGLVTASDELLVLGEGVVVSPVDALELIAQAPAVLVLPAETAVPQGFERIDINHAGAGLMLLPGRLVERLNDLPPDADPASALLRIALQAGISQRMVPQSVSNDGRWLLVQDEAQAHAAEDRWMDRQTSGLGHSPGMGLAAWLSRRFGAAMLHAGSGGSAPGIAGLTLLAMAVGSAWLEVPTLGLALLGAAWLVQRVGTIITGAQADSLGLGRGILSRPEPFGALLDIALVGVLIAVPSLVPGEPTWLRAFAPLVLIGLLRLLSQVLAERFSAWFEDRLLLALALAALGLAGLLPYAVPGLSIVLIVAGIILSRRRGELTSV